MPRKGKQRKTPRLNLRELPQSTSDKSSSPEVDYDGETFGLEALRRLQLVEGTAIDLDVIVKKKEALTLRENRKEHDYVSIAFAVGMVMVFIVFAMLLLSKVDLSTMFGGGAPPAPEAEPIPAMIMGMLGW